MRGEVASDAGGKSVKDASTLARRVAEILAGDRAALGRALTLVENDAPQAGALVAALAPHAGRARVLGITGAPGAGKSTLIDALLAALIERGKRTAVVAVDPSSPVTGGAVLGDRIRMSASGAHPDVFIRSLASRGHHGGVSAATRRVVDVLDAAGFETIIVETVGAGQSEVDIAALADTSIVVCPPGLGDDVQASKAGILEIADILVVSKGDLNGADRTAHELKEMLGLRRRVEGWRVPVVRTVATTSEGVDALLDAIAAHAQEVPAGRRWPEADPTASKNAEQGDAHARVMRLCARDPFVARLGAQCTDAGPGHATVRMAVRPEHLNFNGTCHGGVTFSLADTAFGLASNSRGVIAAGIDAHITFTVAVREGDVLTARAVEVSRSSRIGTYAIEVRREDGTLVSTFTGTVYITSRANEPDATTQRS